MPRGRLESTDLAAWEQVWRSLVPQQTVTRYRQDGTPVEVPVGVPGPFEDFSYYQQVYGLDEATIRRLREQAGLDAETGTNTRLSGVDKAGIATMIGMGTLGAAGALGAFGGAGAGAAGGATPSLAGIPTATGIPSGAFAGGTTATGFAGMGGAGAAGGAAGGAGGAGAGTTGAGGAGAGGGGLTGFLRSPLGRLATGAGTTLLGRVAGKNAEDAARDRAGGATLQNLLPLMMQLLQQQQATAGQNYQLQIQRHQANLPLQDALRTMAFNMLPRSYTQGLQLGQPVSQQPLPPLAPLTVPPMQATPRRDEEE